MSLFVCLFACLPACLQAACLLACLGAVFAAEGDDRRCRNFALAAEHATENRKGAAVHFEFHFSSLVVMRRQRIVRTPGRRDVEIYKCAGRVNSLCLKVPFPYSLPRRDTSIRHGSRPSTETE